MVEPRGTIQLKQPNSQLWYTFTYSQPNFSSIFPEKCQ